MLSDFAGEHIQINRGYAQMTEDRRRGVDGKVVARIQRARRNQSQHTYQRLGDHGAVSDEAGVTFLVQHLGRGTRGDQRVKA